MVRILFVIRIKGDCNEIFFLLNIIYWVIRGWVSRTDIFALGDPHHDTEMLLVARKKKNSRRIKESRAGYEFACKILGLDPLPALSNSLSLKK